MKALYIVAGLLLSFVANGESTRPSTKKSLLERLRGKPAITAVVDSFVITTAVNPKVNYFRDGKYKGLDVVHLKKQVTTFIIQVTGGGLAKK